MNGRAPLEKLGIWLAALASGRRPVVQVGKEVWIDAAPARVWEVLAAVGDWNRWHRGVSFASLRGPLERGSAVHLRLDGMNVLSAVDEVEAGRALGWRGRCFGASLHQRWLLEPASGGTMVKTVESVDGLFVRLIRRTVRKTVERHLDEWLEGLKLRVEGGR